MRCGKCTSPGCPEYGRVYCSAAADLVARCPLCGADMEALLCRQVTTQDGRHDSNPPSRLEALRARMHRVGALYGLGHPLTVLLSKAVDRELNRECRGRHYRPGGVENPAGPRKKYG